jgi:23S rRNA (guanosine2251-2'-O)-methyltransferase
MEKHEGTVPEEISSSKLEGRNPILEALRAGRPVHRILLAKGTQGSVREILRLAHARNILVQEVDPKRIETLAETSAPQGVIAYVAAKEYVEWETMLEAAKAKNEDPLIVILDGLEDPHNLGSVLRSAETAGAHGVIIGKHRAVGLTETVAKASAGAIEYMPVARVTNIAQTMDELKEKGVWVAGADISGDALYGGKDQLTGPLAIVIGGEGQGMSRLVRDKCDFLVSIPMRGKIQSLNASAAAAIILYEAVRQRMGKADTTRI